MHCTTFCYYSSEANLVQTNSLHSNFNHLIIHTSNTFVYRELQARIESCMLFCLFSVECEFFSASIFLNNLVVVARASAREREGAKQFTFEWECFDAVNIDENDGRVEKKRKNVRTIRTSVSVCVRVVLYNSSSSCFFFCNSVRCLIVRYVQHSN